MDELESTGSSDVCDDERSVDEAPNIVVHIPSDGEAESTGSSTADGDERSVDKPPNIVIHLPSERPDPRRQIEGGKQLQSHAVSVSQLG